MKPVLLFLAVFGLMFCALTQAFADGRYVVDGIVFATGEPIAKARPAPPPVVPVQWTYGPIYRPMVVVPSAPPPVIYGPPFYPAPVYPQATLYWHEGYYYYRSELTNWEWQWRQGHWCANPYRH